MQVFQDYMKANYELTGRLAKMIDGRFAGAEAGASSYCEHPVEPIPCFRSLQTNGKSDDFQRPSLAIFVTAGERHSQRQKHGLVARI